MLHDLAAPLLALLATLPGRVDAPAPAPTTAAAPASVERCAFESLARSLHDAGAWRNLGPMVEDNPFLAAELDGIMPGYRLAFVHEASLGLLLVAGDPLGAPKASDEAHWSGLVEETRRSCAVLALSCEIEPLDDRAGGMIATALLEEDGERYRRETVAFTGADSCAYRVQFTAPDAAFAESGWSDIRDAFRNIRRIAGKLLPTNR